MEMEPPCIIRMTLGCLGSNPSPDPWLYQAGGLTTKPQRILRIRLAEHRKAWLCDVMDAIFYITKLKHDSANSSRDNSIVANTDNDSITSEFSDLGNELSVFIDSEAESVGSNDSFSSGKDTAMMGVLNQVAQLASPKKASPVLDVVKSKQDYEEMRLESSTWISTTISGVYHELARIEGFKLLLAYMQGQNEYGIHLKMTPPILTRVTSSQGRGFESTFTVSICVITEDNKRLPEPTNHLVYIEQFPAMHVFVKKVEGLISEEKWLWEARKLAEILQQKEHIRTDVYFTAAYENPLQLMCQENEVWLVKYENEGAIVPLRKDNTINVGDQRLPVPPLVVKSIEYIIACFLFLLACINAILNIGSFIRKNADLVKTAVKSTVNAVVKRNSILNFTVRTSLWYYNKCLDVIQWLGKTQK